MQLMKHKILNAIPSVFSLRPNSDYSSFVVHGSATEMMRASWTRVGRQLSDSIAKVDRDVQKQKAYK